MKISYANLSTEQKYVAELAMQRLGPLPHLKSLLESWLMAGQIGFEPTVDGFNLEQSQPQKKICHFNPETKNITWFVSTFQWLPLSAPQVQVLAPLPVDG
jgi:hypothetical protein